MFLFYKLHIAVWFSGELPLLRHESGSETDVMRILEYLRKLVSAVSLMFLSRLL